MRTHYSYHQVDDLGGGFVSLTTFASFSTGGTGTPSTSFDPRHQLRITTTVALRTCALSKVCTKDNNRHLANTFLMNMNMTAMSHSKRLQYPTNCAVYFLFSFVTCLRPLTRNNIAHVLRRISNTSDNNRQLSYYNHLQPAQNH